MKPSDVVIGTEYQWESGPVKAVRVEGDEVMVEGRFGERFKVDAYDLDPIPPRRTKPRKPRKDKHH